MPTFNTATNLAWRREPTQATALHLHTTERDVLVPDPVAANLLRNPTQLFGTDPALGLLLVEQDLRGDVHRLANDLADAAIEVTLAHDEIDHATRTTTGFARRAASHAASQQLTDATTTLTEAHQQHERAQTALASLRAFVIDLALPDGLLAQAAHGWQRDPARPDYVQTFRSKRAFLDSDSRRDGWGGVEPGGLDFGQQWRRDPDDPTDTTAWATDIATAPAVTLILGGIWRLAYLPRTNEVYAAALDDQLWLLGSGFPDSDAVTALLTKIQADMLAPNSLILAATEIHWHLHTTRAAAPTNSKKG